MSAPVGCCAEVRKGSVGFRPAYAPCTRVGKVERDGKWYCGQHDPQVREARVRNSEERWSAERAQIVRKQRLADAAPDLLAALSAMTDYVAMEAMDRLEMDGSRIIGWSKSPKFSALIDAARAVIAKAKGAPPCKS